MMPFAGGILQHGYQCGMIWGAVLAAGAQAYRKFGPGSQAETMAIMAAQRLVKAFYDISGETNCFEITDLDRSSSAFKMLYVCLINGKTIDCFRMSGNYAKTAFSEINIAYSQKQINALPPPVSCAAILAQKMGLSDKHVAMASGFAGGIGLSGGACGALGAAIWIFGMKSIREGAGKIDYKDSGALEMINTFLKCTDYEFECSEIAGRKFENIDNHAAYLREGGCVKLIETLSAL